MGFYVEPLSFCQENSYYESGFRNYRVVEDDVTGHSDPTYQDLTPSRNASESAILLGDYFSHFVWDEYKLSDGYDAFGDRFNDTEMVKNSSELFGWNENKLSEGFDGLDMVKDPYRHKELYETYESSEKERGTQFEVEHILPWFNCDFGFQYRVDEDYGAAEPKSKYSQSWESWDEMGLYEKIFGNWHYISRSDNESRVEPGPA
ncbi:hypothetical protein AgCh_013278 [Apium graveolens]